MAFSTPLLLLGYFGCMVEKAVASWDPGAGSFSSLDQPEPGTSSETYAQIVKIGGRCLEKYEGLSVRFHANLGSVLDILPSFQQSKARSESGCTPKLGPFEVLSRIWATCRFSPEEIQLIVSRLGAFLLRGLLFSKPPWWPPKNADTGRPPNDGGNSTLASFFGGHTPRIWVGTRTNLGQTVPIH